MRSCLVSIAHSIAAAASYHAVTAILVVVAYVGGMGLAAGSATADSCPNAGMRAQNHSTGLPDCRAYELVTPPFKEGFAPDMQTYADDGTFAYVSPGNFAGNTTAAGLNQYIATRSATGWSTAAMNPPGPTYLAFIAVGAEALSTDLLSSVWMMRRAEQGADVIDYYLRRPDSTFTRMGPVLDTPGTLPPGVLFILPNEPPQTVGASADLSHVLASYSNANLLEFVVGGDAGRVVGVDNTGDRITAGGSSCVNAPASSANQRKNVMSADGRVIFFVAGCNGGVPQVWARINGQTSIEASASECTRTPTDPGGACSGPAAATFVDAAVDGSRVYFTTAEQLVNGDTDATNDLYACDIPPGAPVPVGTANPCSALTEVSGAAPGAAVERVVSVSDDGSRVYFTAQGVLAANLGVNDLVAVPGDPSHHNLYVWEKDAAHPSGRTTFVATVADDVNGQITAEGRYLVFATSSSLEDADTDGAVDVYRYDAVMRGIVRVSSSVNGGDRTGFDATLGSRGAAMTADASKIIFQTDEALSPADANAVTDVYEWQGGQTSLITSDGGRAWGITPSGRDIFFNTTQQVTASDSDTNLDVYDARVGGGFPVAQTPSCSGDGCQLPRTAPPALPIAPAVTPGGSNPAEAAPSFSLRAISASQRKRLAATGKVSLTVTANVAGTVSATATATIAGKSARIGTARYVMTRAATIHMTMTLSRQARLRLRGTGRLTVRIAVSSSRVALPRATTLRLTRATKAGKTTKKSAATRAASSLEGGRS